MAVSWAFAVTAEPWGRRLLTRLIGEIVVTIDPQSRRQGIDQPGSRPRGLPNLADP
jgi:hypothetical protein